MGHYASEMTGDGELTKGQKASLRHMKLEAKRREVLHEARAVGMVAAIEHLIRNSPLPVDLEFLLGHFGGDRSVQDLDGDAAALSVAINDLLASGGMVLDAEQRLRVSS